jgi:hypothetical protein
MSSRRLPRFSGALLSLAAMHARGGSEFRFGSSQRFSILSLFF